MRPDEDPNGRRAAQFTSRGFVSGTLFPAPHCSPGGVLSAGSRPRLRTAAALAARAVADPPGSPTHALGDMPTPLTRLKWSEASRGTARPAAIPGMNLTVEPAAATIASVSVGTARPTVLTGCLAATPRQRPG